MADLSQLSNEDLLKLAQQPSQAASPLAHLSDEELLKMAGPSAKKHGGSSEGLLTYPVTKGLGLLAEGYNKFIDPIAGAPVRAGIGALEEGKGIKGALSAYGNQFGSASGAPTPQQLGEKTGIKSPYLQKVTGGLISTLTDPATYALMGENMFAKGREGLASGIREATVKGGEALTGVPKKASEIYLERSPEINALGKASGGNIGEAADQIRSGYIDQLRGKKEALNQQISDALQKSPTEKLIDETPVIRQLENKKAQINPKLNPESIGEINSIEDRVKSVATRDVNSNQYEKGKYLTNPKDLYDVKNFLQEKAAPSYMQGGQVYVPGKQAQQAAKSGGAIARKTLNENVPEIASANNQHSMLHNIEDTLPKGLLTPGSNENPLIRAGMQNGRERKMLGLLDKQGIPATKQAEDLAAMKHLYDPALSNPTASRSAVTGGIGGILGSMMGHGNPIATAIGMGAGYAITSPKALKMALDAGIIAKPALEAATGLNLFSMSGIAKAHQMLMDEKNEKPNQ